MIISNSENIPRTTCILILIFTTILEILFSSMLLYTIKYVKDKEEKVVTLIAWCVFTFTYLGLILEVLSRTV